MLHLVRGVCRDAQRQGAKHRRASPIADEEMDRASQSVRSTRTEGFRRQAASRHRSCSSSDDPTVQSGTDGRSSEQAQVHQAFDVRARKVRLVEATRAVRLGSLKAHPATRTRARKQFIRFSEEPDCRTITSSKLPHFDTGGVVKIPQRKHSRPVGTGPDAATAKSMPRPRTPESTAQYARKARPVLVP